MCLILTNLESTDMLAILKKKHCLVRQDARLPSYHRLPHDSSCSVIHQWCNLPGGAPLHFMATV